LLWWLSDGSIRHIWQNKPNDGWNTNWASLGGNFSGGFSVARNDDGRVEVFAVGNDGIIYHRWQESNGVWKLTWQPLDGVRFGSSAPAVIINWHNELEVFAVGLDGNVYHRWQNGPGGSFLPWRSLGACPSGCNTIVAATNKDGRAEIFAAGDDDQLRHRWQESNGVWKVPWQTFPTGPCQEPALPRSVSTPQVATNEDGRLEIFMRFIYGDYICHIWQVKPNGDWSDWDFSLDLRLRTQMDSSVTSYDDGRLAIFGLYQCQSKPPNYCCNNPCTSVYRIEYDIQIEPNGGAFFIRGPWDIWIYLL
jgi:hypothetical protein